MSVTLKLADADARAAATVLDVFLELEKLSTGDDVAEWVTDVFENPTMPDLIQWAFEALADGVYYGEPRQRMVDLRGALRTVVSANQS